MNGGRAEANSLILGESAGEFGGVYVHGELDVAETIVVGDAGEGDIYVDGLAGGPVVVTNDADGAGTTYVAAQAGSNGNIQRYP